MITVCGEIFLIKNLLYQSLIQTIAQLGCKFLCVVVLALFMD